MNKPVILSLGAMACAVLVFAVPAYNNLHLETQASGTPGVGGTDPFTGNRWQCVTQSGPDAPNLVILRENGIFLKLIDYKYLADNGTNYDLQGMYDIKENQLLARVSSPSGEVYTDTYTIKRVSGVKMQLTRSENPDSENTRYQCSMQASRS